jgi:methyltransferase (TIGR00027 family)
MEEGKPSVTAVFTSISRAAHLFLDDDPKILRDDFALGFSDVQGEPGLKTYLGILSKEFSKIATPELAQCILHSMRGFAVLRHRFAEDELVKAIKHGISQYVILGAGLDSFAYRRPDLHDKLHIFEVDYPATQQWKKTRLQELNISLPDNLTFVPVDFEKQTLKEELCTCGFDATIPAFFSWLGVTCYLTEAAVFQTLKEIVSMPSGSEIVFDYALSNSLLGEGERQIWALGQATPNEPDLTQFEPRRLVAHLREIGFSRVTDFGPKEANERYFNGRTDDLSPFVLNRLFASVIKLYHLMKATV